MKQIFFASLLGGTDFMVTLNRNVLFIHKERGAGKNLC
ncbi:hypothetical protein Cabys_2443 [Caldithrix abyssi DSM 13497]|uniref:Uncharacterized protein n=1 Tax=Caldithrix abyssi DSM 13497 TaxID=880073 RepID=A0A1J1CBA4_CALAY|nr:hypothetical protein Cabys_2443 [Caldithrix abyssi DSM 13497]